MSTDTQLQHEATAGTPYDVVGTPRKRPSHDHTRGRRDCRLCFDEAHVLTRGHPATPDHRCDVWPPEVTCGCALQDTPHARCVDTYERGS